MVVIDKKVAEEVFGRFKRSKEVGEVGLVVGQGSTVVCWIPFPRSPLDGSPLPGADVDAAYDDDVIGETARYVARMMVGGLRVLGVYSFAPVLSAKRSRLVSLTRRVGDSLPPHLTTTAGGLILLLLDAGHSAPWTSRKAVTALRVAPVQGPEEKESLTVDSGAWASFVELRATVHVCLRVPAAQPGFRDLLEQRIDWFQAELKEGVCEFLFNGNTVVHLHNPEDSSGPPPATVANVFGVTKIPPPAELTPLSVRFYTPLADDAVGDLVLKGTVDARAFVSLHESVSFAVDVLHRDIVNTLRHRLSDLTDELDLAVESNSGGGFNPFNDLGRKDRKLVSGQQWTFPLRVFFPLSFTNDGPGPALYASEYVYPGEQLAECAARAMDVFEGLLDRDLLETDFLHTQEQFSATNKFPRPVGPKIVVPKGKALSSEQSVVQKVPLAPSPPATCISPLLWAAISILVLIFAVFYKLFSY